VYADQLGLLRSGSPIDAAPQLVTLGARVFRPPVWSGTGDIYVGLAHGDVARVDASGLHVLALPKAIHLPWKRSHDQLYSAHDGSVWVAHCTKPGKLPDECGKALYLRVDVAGGKPTSTGPTASEPAPWPKVEPPSGYSLRTTRDGGGTDITCERAPKD